MPYYAAERLDTGTLPLPVGVASHNQRFDIAPTGMPLYRRGFTTSKLKGLGGCGCGLGATTLDSSGAFLPWLLLAGGLILGYLALKQ